MQLSLTPLSYIKYKSGNKLHAVSVLKLLMALMVIQIHTPSSWRAFSMPLLRIAVPVFFMISGYFILLDNGTFSLSRISKSIRKIGLIILSANIVYLALYATVLYRNGQDIIAELSSIRLWIDAIFLGGSFGFHLWYLTAFMGNSDRDIFCSEISQRKNTFLARSDRTIVESAHGRIFFPRNT